MIKSSILVIQSVSELQLYSGHTAKNKFVWFCQHCYHPAPLPDLRTCSWRHVQELSKM